MTNFIDRSFYSIDFNVAKFFHILEANCGNWLTNFMKLISILGDAGIFMILVGLILCIFVKTRKVGVTILFSIAISAVITNFILKPLIARDRPFVDTTSPFYTWWQNAGSSAEDSFSFPSGHATASMAFALSIFATIKNKKLSSIVLIFPIIMASSRIYLMVHYFSDCVFGFLVACIGTVCAYLITKLIFEKTKGKFNKFVNEFSITSIFKK